MAINLDLMRKDAIYRIENSIFGIGRNCNWTNFRNDTQELCNNFLIMAGASLLADMNTNNFFLNLSRCAENWRRFLSFSSTIYNTSPSLSYNSPILAAVVCYDRALLKKIIAVMPKTWQKGEEYQDQFHYTWLLVLLSESNCRYNEDVQKHLSALEQCENNPSRQVLVKGLLGLDDLGPQDFWDKFESMLYEQEEKTEKCALSFTTPVVKFAAHRSIWFEGLAWLRLAKNNGFTLPSSSYLYCPDEALMDMPEPYRGDWVLLADKAI